MRLWRKRTPTPAAVPWVVVAFARHQPEADLIVNLLRDGGINAYHRRSRGFDVPDFLALGPREVMVPQDQATDAASFLNAAAWQAAPGEPSP